MNWEELIKKYPKAIRKLNKWANTKDNWHVWTNKYHRVLYDFFDEQRIMSVSIIFPIGNKKFNFGYKIYEAIPDGGTIHESDRYFDSRSEAEEAMWLKEFEILEKQLK